MDALRKYVRSLGEREEELQRLGQAACVLVVPTYDEGPLEALDASFRRACPDGRLVVVLNAPKGAPTSALEANEATRRWARGRACVLEAPGIEGVGAARRYGMDLACMAYALGRVDSPWLHMSDADAELPEDYLSSDDADAVALVHPFVHEPLHDAIRHYELYLRYYVAGLRYARSKYAFHSIGSTISVRAPAYAQVRGVPRRAAGEDFHLLNKLRKVGEVRARIGAPIRLSSRASARVPFGTGPAIAEIRRGQRPIALHDPRVFDALRWIRTALHRVIAIPSELAPFVDGVRPRGEFQGGAARRRRALDEHFDGLRTRQLIHRLRDALYPDLNGQDALERAPFIDDPARALEALRHAQGVR